jgi:hypothetical protein
MYIKNSLKIVAFATTFAAQQITAQKVYTDSAVDLVSFVQALTTTYDPVIVSGGRLLDSEDLPIDGKRNLASSGSPYG